MDLNDTAKAGISLADLVAAAEHEDHLLGRNWNDLVQHGMKALTELVASVGRAQDRAEMVRLLASYQADPARRRATAMAMTRCPAEVSALLLELQTGPSGGSTAIRSFERTLREEVKTVESMIDKSNEAHRTATLDSLLRDIDVKGLRVPYGFNCDKSGVTTADGKAVALAPIVIIGSGEDVATGERTLELAWLAAGKWRRQIVDRRTALDSRAIISLVGAYAPVSTANAGGVVAWLAAFEAENATRLLERSISRHMGWVGGAFVLGARCIGGEVSLFDPSGEARGFRAHGDERAWRDFADTTLSKIPTAMALIYASVCTPLLDVVRGHGFVVDLSGESSRGKTTLLRVAASVWGSPSEYDDGTIRTWESASIAGVLTQAWFRQSVPVILDETKLAKKPEVVATALYAVPSGQDRTRLTQSGDLKQARRWRTALLSTGEAPTSSFSQAAGAQARNISIPHTPLPSAEVADEIAWTVGDTYGHCGPALVEWLVAHRDLWPTLREDWRDLARAHAARLGPGVGSRVGGYLATMELAARILHQDMRYLAGGYEPGMGVLMSAAERSVVSADVPRDSLDALWGWIAANQEKFYNRSAPPPKRGEEPVGGWVGRWDRTDDWDEKWIGVNLAVARKLLEGWGYAAGDQIAAWTRRGWLVLDAESKHPKWGKSGARVMVVHRWALEGLAEQA